MYHKILSITPVLIKMLEEHEASQISENIILSRRRLHSKCISIIHSLGTPSLKYEVNSPDSVLFILLQLARTAARWLLCWTAAARTWVYVHTHSSRERHCPSPVVFILFMYSTYSTETDIETVQNGWYDVNMTVHESWMQIK